MTHQIHAHSTQPHDRLRDIGELLARALRRAHDMRSGPIREDSPASCLDLLAKTSVNAPGAGSLRPEEHR